MDRYKTVLREATCELVEKRSRFISSVKPVSSEAQAAEFVKAISDTHKDATHNVFAYVISDTVEIQKASDDGEPQGTAGIPVLEVIKKEGLTNVCVVVTRYFGGVLLGAGGLIRAYSSSARNGIHEAKICTMDLFASISVNIGYHQLGRVQNSIAAMGNTILNIEYTESVKLLVKTKHEKIDSTTKAIRDITNGEAKIEHVRNFYDLSREG